MPSVNIFFLAVHTSLIDDNNVYFDHKLLSNTYEQYTVVSDTFTSNTNANGKVYSIMIHIINYYAHYA